ncbi:hypothetical protein DsansV1_C19g0156911 [Dioscorea sansibarensis]
MALLRLLLLLFLCSSLVVQGRLLGCMSGNSCMREEEMAPPAEPRKNIKTEEMKGLRPLERRSRGDLVGLDLRWVPSGPDPLHHSGSPRKPRTP